MSLFKRNRAKGAGSQDAQVQDAETTDGETTDGETTGTELADVEREDVATPAYGTDSVDPTEPAVPAEPVQPVDRADGPFDVSEVDGVEGRLDVGALLLPLVEGLEIQLQLDEASGQVTGVFLVQGDSAVQLQAFAAPRTQGIWREVCDEIAVGITEQGGTADQGQGRFGYELLARVPAQQPDGRVGFQPLRFTGVDGPRWMLRAVFHGRAAIDPEGAVGLEAVVSQVVVSRGKEPMGPRELLPLRLPEDAQPAAAEADAEASEASGEGAPQAGGEPGVRTHDDLQPFERGPEITERR